MKSLQEYIQYPVKFRPVFQLVNLFEEKVEYNRLWCLPFNSIFICTEEDPSDPSWVKLPESGEHDDFFAGCTRFTTCDTPIHLRYTTANRHKCIHFRYEIFPGVDLFSGLHSHYMLHDQELHKRLCAVFLEQDPLRRIAMAENVALEVLMQFWPEKLPVDFNRIMHFSELLDYVKKNLDSTLGVPEMAAFMGWSEAHFSRMFRDAFHITPKQYLIRELFARAAALLNDPGKSIKQVAQDLNFSTEFNFSRFVKKYSGYTPSELKRNECGMLYIRK